MPWLAGFLIQIFGGVLGFLASYFTKKVAIGVSVAAVLLTVTTAFYLALKALIAGVMLGVSNPWFLMAFYAIWPSNAETCITAIFSAEILSFLYRHQLMTIKAVASNG